MYIEIFGNDFHYHLSRVTTPHNRLDCVAWTPITYFNNNFSSSSSTLAQIEKKRKGKTSIAKEKIHFTLGVPTQN